MEIAEMESLPPYSSDELSRIAAAGLPVWGKLDEHPAMVVGCRRYRPISFPEEIVKLNMESTDNRCNLRCAFCFQSERYENSRRRERYMRMPLDVARRIVDALPNLRVFVPYSINEPGMVPKNLSTLLPYVWKQRHAQVFVSTNLSLPWKNYEPWIGTAGVERVIIGAGGATKATHEFHRPGSRWEVMLDNIRRLLELRAREGWPHAV
jgi:MoaA/NifB/PqqE/SkfB family radical SAM enzyme